MKANWICQINASFSRQPSLNSRRVNATKQHVIITATESLSCILWTPSRGS